MTQITYQTTGWRTMVPGEVRPWLRTDAQGNLLVSTAGSTVSSGGMSQAEYLAATRCTITRTTINSSTSSATAVAANANRKSVSMTNSDVNRGHVNAAGTAATFDDIPLAQYGYYAPEGTAVPTNAMTVIWEGDGSGVLVVYEGA